MLKKLREKLAAKTGELKELQPKAFADEATVEDTNALKAALDEIDKINSDIKLAEQTEKAIADAALPSDEDIGGNGAPAKPKMVNDTATKLGLIVGSMVEAYNDDKKANAKNAAEILIAKGYGQIAGDLVASYAKSANTLTPAGGGVTIGETFDPNITELLYPMSSFMKGDPTVIPMPRGNYKTPAGATGASAGYRAEGAQGAHSQPTFREISMSAHLLTGITSATNQLLDYSEGYAERFMMNDMGAAMSVALDTSAYLATGTGDDPTGIMQISGTTEYTATGGAAPTMAQVDADCRKMLNHFTRYPILQQKLAWRMSVRTIGYLQDMRDGNGNKVYPELSEASPRFKGYPVMVAGTFPENLGAGTNETYLSLICFQHVLFGDTKGVTLKVSDIATINNGTADVSMFATDSTAIMATAEHDFTTRYEETVVNLTAVQWGA